MSGQSGSEECKEQKIEIAIVVSEFNYDITRIMLEKAEDHARFLGAGVKITARAPGTYDIPVLVKKILERGGIDAIVTLGAVIEGETEHDEVVAHQAARKIMDLSVEYGVPVTLGIIGPGATRLQALERAEEYARRAVEAAVKLVRRIREIGCGQS
ncbi:MAG TPA: 6,7-dimethyl-8-ribityllumazine synthase [Sulfolobales archaeon]|nr:6,7-dimethyl-8-ribityllumazine synthase [Sulfolobales archaeon]